MNDLFKQEFLTQKEVAKLFRVSEATVRNWRERGLLPYWQAPGSTRVLYLSNDVKDFYEKYFKQSRGGDRPKPFNGIKKGRPGISSNRKWKV